jgi:hypothetical protein
MLQGHNLLQHKQLLLLHPTDHSGKDKQLNLQLELLQLPWRDLMPA